jgi:hypothetical protein
MDVQEARESAWDRRKLKISLFMKDNMNAIGKILGEVARCKLMLSLHHEMKLFNFLALTHTHQACLTPKPKPKAKPKANQCAYDIGDHLKKSVSHLKTSVRRV